MRVLAIRDEDPERPWQPWGAWWPERPTVHGVRDELAGGAWIAADGSRLAVLLNRAGGADVPVPSSRGSLVLDAVAGRPLPQPLTTLGFNLVEVQSAGARVTSWDGGHPRVTDLLPGTHMVAHEDLDDPATPRIAEWLGRFAATATDDRGDGRWWEGWVGLLEESARLDATDDRAIIRDNRPHGHPTLSLLVAVASVAESGIRVATDALRRPGRWNRPRL